MTKPTVTAEDLSVIILAAGSGDRMSSPTPKQYLELGDEDDPHRTVMDLLLADYDRAEEVAEIRVICAADYLDRAHEIADRYPKVRGIVIGGEVRHDSVRIGAESVETKITLIHDAARPLLYQPALEACFKKFQNGARSVGTIFHPYASMVIATDDGPMTGVMERNEIAYGLCPVAYYTEDLLDAFRLSDEQGIHYRDEPAMMRVFRPDIITETVQGHPSCFKLTYPEDIDLLAVYRRWRAVEESG